MSSAVPFDMMTARHSELTRRPAITNPTARVNDWSMLDLTPDLEVRALSRTQPATVKRPSWLTRLAAEVRSGFRAGAGCA